MTTTGTQAPDAPGAGRLGRAREWFAELLGQYVEPYLMPIAIVATVVFWVLNASRILFGLQGMGAMIILTVVILAEVVAFFGVPEIKSSSTALLTSGVLVVVLTSGLVVMGVAAKGAGGPVIDLGDPIATVKVESGNLYFKPKNLGPVPPGVIRIDVNNVSGAHTLVFEDPAVEVEKKISIISPGALSGKARLPSAGDYVFFCDIPGHRASGMEGVLTAEGSAPPAGGGATSTSAGATTTTVGGATTTTGATTTIPGANPVVTTSAG